ncbi:hypothetical protein ACHAXA_000141 [Cyclostephanos tholiformis]|uniref:SET domain-containing protein n=1 Tax=Cyclostephanos tholiformis TaxID=382380 RepID=A0ABD3SCP0_9STRA
MAKGVKRTDSVDDGGRNHRKAAPKLKLKSKNQSSTGKDYEVLRSIVSGNSPKKPRLRHGYTLAVMIGPAIFVLYTFLSRERNDDSISSNDYRIPQVDRMEISPDPERDDRTLDFLRNFVCNHKRDSDAITVEANVASASYGEAYCHPRLSAEPHYRTQRVSLFSRAIDETSFPWWRKIIHHFVSDAVGESSRDDGIPAGTLVMRLPRHLQIWDLDAIRDQYIQREFLGLDPTLNGDEYDSTERIRFKMAAVHKDTGNPLDSGAFLAVYLIRLLDGSRAQRSSDITADEQCNNDDGKCNLPQQWNKLDQFNKQRLRELSKYLHVLPTVSDRLADLPSNPHNHPLFWPLYTMEALFPRYTVTNDLIRHYGTMIKSEYDALTLVSTDFEENVLYFDYLSMRINVLSRAFGVSASKNDGGAIWGVPDDRKGVSLIEEMRSYETSNFGKFLDDVADYENEGFKFRSMCPLLDMYNSHPNSNAIWRYDSKTSSYAVHASNESNIPPGHSIVVSYGKYTDGHLFAKYGYINGDGSSPTEISLAAFHRILGDIGLGRQFSLLPFDLLDQNSRHEILGTLFEEGSNSKTKTKASLVLAAEALYVQSKELLRYLQFDDGYKECIDLNVNSGSNDEKLKLLKWQHLILIANNRDMWIVRVPPTSPDARPMQAHSTAKHGRKDEKTSVGLNAESVISTCRLLSLIPDDLGGNAIEHLREGLAESASSIKSRFRLERHEDALEYRAMICLVRLCNVALGRYSKIDGKEPDTVGSREWNAWYIIGGEVRALEILRKTAASEAHKLRKHYQGQMGGNTADTEAAMTVREEGACPLNYSLPLLNNLHEAKD